MSRKTIKSAKKILFKNMARTIAGGPGFELCEGETDIEEYINCLCGAYEDYILQLEQDKGRFKPVSEWGNSYDDVSPEDWVVDAKTGIQFNKPQIDVFYRVKD